MRPPCSWSNAASFSEAIRDCADWYYEVRQNAPLWLGLGESEGQIKRLWRFAAPGPVESSSEVRAAAFLAARDEILPSFVTHWGDELKEQMKKEIDAIQWPTDGSVTPGSTDIPPQELLDMGKRSGLTGGPRSGLGAQSVYTDDDLRRLHTQAEWLAGCVHRFADGVGRWQGRFHLADASVWEIRAPMLSESECRSVIDWPVRDRNFNRCAIALVASRGELTEQTVGKRLR